MRLRTRILGVTLLAMLLAWRSDATGQAVAPDDEREQTFVEALRRDDPGEADRYVALRDARVHAIDELQRVRAQYLAAGPELRVVFVPRLKEAERRYADTSLALLDFLDARDRRAIARYEQEIGRIGRSLEERRRTRAELEKLLGAR